MANLGAQIADAPSRFNVQHKHRGAFSEACAVAWLLAQGYDVFRNFSNHGLADLVAVDFARGHFLLVDVKSTGRATSSGKWPLAMLTTDQLSAGVRPLYVTPGGRCGWYDEFAAENGWSSAIYHDTRTPQLAKWSTQ